MELGFQLYSARNFKPWKQVLGLLAENGYTQLEGYGEVYEEGENFRRLMDEAGLKMPSGHFSIEMLESDPDGVAEIAGKLGMNRIVCPFIAQADRPDTQPGWERFAVRLHDISKHLARHSLKFAWHNHDFEFRTVGKNVVPMQILLENAPAMEWEADIAWIVRAGADPFEWIARYGSRIGAVHVKDIAPYGEAAEEDGWADVGHGTMPWPQLIETLRDNTPCQHFLVEHDNPADLERFASRSADSLRAFAGADR